VSAITTHVLDTSKGRPAKGVSVLLEFQSADGTWLELARGATNDDGRVADLLPKDKEIVGGIYRITFNTGRYYSDNQTSGFYPLVPIIFEIKDSKQHYHVPLLLNPFGYSTYRGS
jgi:5-hydroxyisourate hydrolase